MALPQILFYAACELISLYYILFTFRLTGVTAFKLDDVVLGNLFQLWHEAVELAINTLVYTPT
jgi:hypothetical protein